MSVGSATIPVMVLATLLIGLLVGVLLGYLIAHARIGARLAAATAELDATRAAAERQVEAERRAAAQQIESARLTQEQLREMFAALSSDALHRNSRAFVDLATETLKQITTAAEGDLAKRQQAIEALLTPLRESLAKVEQQIEQVEKERADAYGALRQQVESMGKTSEQLRLETQQLVQALRAPQARGAWGEYQLRRVVEFAGMLEHCDFVEQATTDAEDARLRPDMIVRLPGGKHVVVDAKVPLVGFLDAMAAPDPATRDEHVRRHARHLRQHIDHLASKAYWAAVPNTPEFVVLFVPAEAFLSAALETDPDLLQYAMERNVIVATPTTLVLMLRTVAYTWRQEALAANAQQVLDLARSLYARLATLGGHVNKLGERLGSAVRSYNDAVASLESRVLVTARRLADLKVTADDLESPRQVEVTPRRVQAAELVASADETLVSLPERDTG
ncbi:MAG: DNA recombination protein RmuC [Acidothermus cellulolyticus]|nr:DNA recombination protein RmuC [Acidothermus cellulolyticus]